MDWASVRDELKHLLEEWAVTGDSKEHKRFRVEIFKEVREMVESRGYQPSYDKLKQRRFPKDSVEAVKYVFQSDIESDPPSARYETFSLLPVRGAPYRRKIRGQKVWYNRIPAFDGIPSPLLDPFQRYQFGGRISEAEFWYYRWFLSDPESDAGMIFEARLACHAVHNVPCFHCKFKSLQWNGGSDESWQDLVCTECRSMYEVKTKESMEKIEINFEQNRIHGGDFSRFCKLKNGLQSNQKMFMVLLPRLFTLDKLGNKCHPAPSTVRKRRTDRGRGTAAEADESRGMR